MDHLEPGKSSEPKAEFDYTSNAMWERSGKVESGTLTAFLYVLMRDGDLAPGRIEDLVDQLHSESYLFSNGWLAKYANDVAVRLTDEQKDSDDPLEPCG